MRLGGRLRRQRRAEERPQAREAARPPVERAARGAGDRGLAGERRLDLGLPVGRRRRLRRRGRTAVLSSSFIDRRRSGYPHRRREPVAERVLAPGDLDEQRPLEGVAAPEDELAPGPDPALVEKPQHLRVAVGDAGEDRRVAGIELGQRDRVVGGDVELGARDRVAVRVEARVAELRGDPRARDPRRCSARAPRPRRGPDPRACRARRRGRTRSAGGGGSPRAPRARPTSVSATPW